MGVALGFVSFIAIIVLGINVKSLSVIEVAPESAVTMVSLYPELKSDSLVQAQIEVYTENNKTIRDLRDKQIKGNVYRWWLYFGGGDT